MIDLNRNELANSLMKIIRIVLKSLGLTSDVLVRWEHVIYAFLILFIAFGVGWIVYVVTHRIALHISARKGGRLASTFIRTNFLKRLSMLVPPIIILSLLPFAFYDRPVWLNVLLKVGAIYLTIAVTFFCNSLLGSVGVLVLSKSSFQNKPLKGLVQILQVLVILIACILTGSILMDKSPVYLLTGLSAFAAVLLLIFKDSIMGFVAGVLLSKNDMIQIGDWIEIPGTAVNGTVLDVTLTVVKVQNFDNTTATIPPYTLVSAPFINWRGMADSGGRRIMKQFMIRLDSVQEVTDQQLADYRKLDEDLAHFIDQKLQQLAAGNVANTDNPSGLPNGTIDTNLGLFRAYLYLYLRRRKEISRDLLLMIRLLNSSGEGVPLQIWAFSINKNWSSYESIQAEIVEHTLVMLPKFGLVVYQTIASIICGKGS